MLIYPLARLGFTLDWAEATASRLLSCLNQGCTSRLSAIVEFVSGVSASPLRDCGIEPGMATGSLSLGWLIIHLDQSSS